MGEFLLISDAAKEVQVESHVLRYWEEELRLPIKRNELGHRYYTQDDVERFKQIKGMKERGLQLKAIKMILRDGRLDVLPQEESYVQPDSVRPDGAQFGSVEPSGMQPGRQLPPIGKSVQQMHLEQYIEREGAQSAGREQESSLAIEITGSRNREPEIYADSREEKFKRLQWLLQQLIRESLRENNQELCREIKEHVIKEMDYQFRAQEEREEERERRQEERGEAYYQKMDELLRSKSSFYGRFKKDKEQKAKKTQAPDKKDNVTPITDKKKRHFIF